jgi:hypothetical protein
LQKGFHRLIPIHWGEPPGFAGGSDFQIGWSHDEQNDEQVFA